MADNPLRKLPPVNQVLAALAEAGGADLPQEHVTGLVRAELASLRQRLRHEEVTAQELEVTAIAGRVAEQLSRSVRPLLRPVINATGILLHTNLGRSPLAEEAVEAVANAARGYINLELDLATGKRSSRQAPVRDWLIRLTGAESATVVNNCAAATVIVLRALAQGKEVVVSRGQLIEIGGSFRIPEIMAVSGAVLHEVGTTNITRASDYERAIGPATGALMLIHTSNYRVSGFTRSVPLVDLVTLGRRHQVPVIDDAGSGAFLDFRRFGFRGEPVVQRSVQAGADLVLFSGDKLLGGPQAGIIVGRAPLIQRIEKDPLMRAFRLDKLTLSALEATLRLYLDEERALRAVPALRMLNTPIAELRNRAEALAVRMRAVPGIRTVRVASDVAYVGGGSLPDQSMPTVVLEVEPGEVGDTEVARRLRVGSPAVMARLRDGTVILDLRTVFAHQETVLLEALTAAVRPASTSST